MFQTKICGVTTIDDALMTAAAGVGAIGLNFYPRSPRFVSPGVAQEIVRALPRGVVKVGLFVNAPAQEVVERFGQLDLDIIQLHGDEPPEHIAELGGRPVMRAFRVGADGLRGAMDYLGKCRRLGCLPSLVLLDGYREGQFGGAGRVADWSVVAQYPCEEWRPPLVLAGGLTSENVAEAIAAVRPAAVDVASGVESGPGKKSPELVRRFLENAAKAFCSLPRS
jgi:phosphoribosylanthranilate isomerase